MNHVPSTVRSALAGLALAAMSAIGAQAATVDVTVDNQVFTIGTVSGTYVDNLALLEAQPWWGDTFEAAEFAAAVGASLGFPNGNSDRGPGFAVSILGNPPFLVTRAFNSVGGTAGSLGFFSDSQGTFAVVATPAPIPLPPAAALMLAGLGALGLATRRR